MPPPRVTSGWPEEAFLGDILVCTLQGQHLDTVTDARIGPVGKGVEIALGDPYGKLPTPPVKTAAALTITVQIGYNTYPGEKRVELVSSEGNSNSLPFTIMM
jgi:hypothetical protein